MEWAHRFCSKNVQSVFSKSIETDCERPFILNSSEIQTRFFVEIENYFERCVMISTGFSVINTPWHPNWARNEMMTLIWRSCFNESGIHFFRMESSNMSLNLIGSNSEFHFDFRYDWNISVDFILSLMWMDDELNTVTSVRTTSENKRDRKPNSIRNKIVFQVLQRKFFDTSLLRIGWGRWIWAEVILWQTFILRSVFHFMNNNFEHWILDNIGCCDVCVNLMSSMSKGVLLVWW